MHLDPFANERFRSEPVDGAKWLATYSDYDSLGRLSRKTFESSTSGLADGSGTVLNTHDYGYDNLNRFEVDCHYRSDESYTCRAATYDGLSTSEIDEDGRITTRIVDAAGRLSIQRAMLPAGSSSAASDTFFTYGYFNELEQEKVRSTDGTTIDGQTDLAYDLLGRNTSVTRKRIFLPTVLTYNAFGEVATKYKVHPTTGQQFYNQTFTHDGIGRVTSLASSGWGPGTGVPPGLNRTFTWDVGKNGPVPSGRGKLNDVTDTSFGNSIHFDYDGNGRMSAKTWTIANPQNGTSESYQFQFQYDSQGRPLVLTYPMIPGETKAMGVKYGYDQYNGATLQLADAWAAKPETIIWKATARNEWGEPTSESLSFKTRTLTRTTGYYLPDGRLYATSLNGTNGWSSLEYTYSGDGLPTSIKTFGLATWSSTFGYDNLRRLSWWAPAPNTIVNYGFDADGNLQSRSWANPSVWATVGYSFSGTDSSLSVSGTGTSGGASYTDTYLFDGAGDLWQTPTISNTWFTDDEQIYSVTERASGQMDTLIYDGLGQRVLTLYGTNGSAGTLLTLDGLFELRRDSAGTLGRCHLFVDGKAIGDLTDAPSNGVSNRNLTYYLTDNVGSVVAEASAAGTVTPRAERDPFGNLIANPTVPDLPREPTGADPDGTSRMGFAGHDRDKTWGAVDMVSRWYSPRLGRFLSPDGIIPNPYERTENNPYAYVRNSPTALWDPDGHCGEPEGGDPCPGFPLPLPDWPTIKKKLGEAGDWTKREAGNVWAKTKDFGQAIADGFTGNGGEHVAQPKSWSLPGAQTNSQSPGSSVTANAGTRQVPGFAAIAKYGIFNIPSPNNDREVEALETSVNALKDKLIDLSNACAARNTEACGEAAQLFFRNGIGPVGLVPGQILSEASAASDLAAIPRSLGAAADITTTSQIGASSYATRLAEGLGQAAQRDVDALLSQLRFGNLNPGVGTRALGNGFLELRGANSGRVIVKQTGPGSFDIVGKFQGHVRGDAANSAIIKRLINDY